MTYYFELFPYHTINIYRSLSDILDGHHGAFEIAYFCEYLTSWMVPGTATGFSEYTDL